MLKSLAVLALFVVLAGRVSCQPYKARSNKDQPPAKQQPTAPIGPNSDDHYCYSQQASGDSDDKPFEWHTAVKRSEWWLVVLGFGTLIVVGWQTKTLGKSVVAAQRAADAASAQIEMVKSKERARLRIELRELVLQKTAETTGYSVDYEIVLDGNTQAYILEDACFAGIWPTHGKSKERMWWRAMEIPRVITPATTPVSSFTLVHADGLPPQIETDESLFQLVREGKRQIYCEGTIRYRNTYGDVWRLNFQRIWRYYPMPEGYDLSGGRWEWCGNPKANGEYKENRDSAAPPPWPCGKAN